MSSDKDAILDAILALEKKMVAWKTDFDAAQLTIAEKEPALQATVKEYEDVKARMEAQRFELRQAKLTADTTLSNARMGRDELEKLKRQLARLADAEKIKADLLEKFDALATKLPDAIWRVGNKNGDKALPHQVEGAIHMAIAGRVINGDERGVGKTLTSLIYCDLVEAKKIIVIVPSDVQAKFGREVQLWTNRPVIKLGGNSRHERDFIFSMLKNMPEYVCILNYQAWRRDPQLIDDLIELKPDTLILDEAHHAKTVDTVTCKGIMKLVFTPNMCECGEPQVEVIKKMATCYNCDRYGLPVEFNTIKNVVPMTGTPILNMPQEMYALCHIVDPHNFKSANDYLHDFCRKSDGKWKWAYGGEKKLTEKIGPRFIKRTRHDAGIILPPMEVIKHTIPWSEFEVDYPQQHKYYLQARDYAEIMLDPDNEVVMSMPIFLTVLLRLRQVITAPTGIELRHKDPETKEVKVLAKIDTNEAVKLDKAEEVILEALNEGDRVVVFSQLAEPLWKLKERLGDRAAVYAGGVSDATKREIELDFDAKETPSDQAKYKVALVNYKSGGEGLEFTGANHTVILDREWNPGKESQAAGRMDRMGQTKDMFVHIIEVENTVDEWMAGIIDAKAKLIAGFDGELNIFRKAYEALKEGKL